MRILRCLLALFVPALLSSLAAGQPTGRVVRLTEAAEVRSGPGQDYYATGELAAGTAVHVYRRLPGGWLAIRPPEGSFDWVPADGLTTTSGHTAEVEAAETVAWIGSSVTRVEQHKWQTQLRAGERVEVLGSGKVVLSAGDAATECLKIAPPVGEYRWIHRDATVPRPVTPPAVLEAGPAAMTDAEGRLTSHAEPDARSAALPGWQPAQTDQLVDQLRQAEIHLSAMLATDVTVWRLGPLHDDVRAIADVARTQRATREAQALLKKIVRYADVQDRFLALQQVGGRGATEPSTASRGQSQAPRRLDAPLFNARPIGTGVAERPLTTTYDGQGTLVRVHSPNRLAPPYALVDAQGRVVSYVSPAPGLNLRRYLKKSIGIIGQQAYLAQLKTNHVTAERIVELDRHRR